MAAATSETSSEEKKFCTTLESFNKVVDQSLNLDPFSELGIDILNWFDHTCVFINKKCERRGIVNKVFMWAFGSFISFWCILHLYVCLLYTSDAADE